jgi:hypothetical protein
MTEDDEGLADLAIQQMLIIFGSCATSRLPVARPLERRNLVGSGRHQHGDGVVAVPGRPGFRGPFPAAGDVAGHGGVGRLERVPDRAGCMGRPGVVDVAAQ